MLGASFEVRGLFNLESIEFYAKGTKFFTAIWKGGSAYLLYCVAPSDTNCAEAEPIGMLSIWCAT